MLLPLLLVGAGVAFLAFQKGAQTVPDAGSAPVAMGQILKQAAYFDGSTPAQSARVYVVELGDYPAFIAKKITGSANRWPELVAANPGKPRAPSGSFQTLLPGEALTVPEAWVMPAAPSVPTPEGPPAPKQEPAPAPKTEPKTEPGPTPPTGDVSSSDGSIVNALPKESLLTVKRMLVDWAAREKYPAGEYGGVDVADAWTARDANVTKAFQIFTNKSNAGDDAAVKLPETGALTEVTVEALLAYENAHGVSVGGTSI